MILTVVIIAGSTLGLSLGQSSSGVRDCGHNEQCVSTEKCPEYLIKREELNNLPQLGPQYKRLLAELKSQVCNKAQRKICCPPTPPTPSGECGLSKLPSGFIIGGVSAEKGEFPFLALIGERKVSREVCLPKGCHNEYETRWFCAGNIINTGWVLTAAHCKPRNETFIVRLGEHILEGVGSYDPDVTGELPLGWFGSEIKSDHFQTWSNDIALVRLPRPARPSQVVQVVCLPWGNFSSSLAQTGMVVGWGKTSNEQESINKNTGVFSKKQQKLEVPIQIQDCPSRSRVNSSTQICAGGELGKDSCNGDSGGGLFWREGDLEESDSAWYLLGITSFGSKSCGVGRSAVYTRVSAFLDWIETNIKKYE